MNERLGIAGTGEIACGLAAVASLHSDVVMWARSSESADRARASVARNKGDEARVRVETEIDALGEASFLVEAVREELDVKIPVLVEVDRVASSEAVLASTTSSLSLGALAAATTRADRFVGLHVFNPVRRMPLVELAFPAQASDETRKRAHELCQALDKTAVEVPADLPGFVVNRLLFPYLFDAVRLLEHEGLGPDQVDQCMKLGAGHPMGPLALLDLVGLDVSAAIGDAIETEVPARVRGMVEAGALGRKSGRGFYDYR